MRSLSLVITLAVLAALGSCGGSSGDSTPGGATAGNSAQSAAASPCAGLRTRVENYNTLRPGTSRRAYLILLHTLQATCPKQAQQAGLTSSFLKKCHQLPEENCTAYKDPYVGRPQIP